MLVEVISTVDSMNTQNNDFFIDSFICWTASKCVIDSAHKSLPGFRAHREVRATCLCNMGSCNHGTRTGPKSCNSHSFSNFRSQAEGVAAEQLARQDGKIYPPMAKRGERAVRRPGAAGCSRCFGSCCPQTLRNRNTFRSPGGFIRLSTLQPCDYRHYSNFPLKIPMTLNYPGRPGHARLTQSSYDSARNQRCSVHLAANCVPAAIPSSPHLV